VVSSSRVAEHMVELFADERAQEQALLEATPREVTDSNVLTLVRPSGADDPPTPPRRPDMTDPVICLIVRGFRDLDAFDEPTPSLSRDEKLQIYYEPFNYLIAREADDGPYRAHLVQDIRIRRAGMSRSHAVPSHTGERVARMRPMLGNLCGAA